MHSYIDLIIFDLYLLLFIIVFYGRSGSCSRQIHQSTDTEYLRDPGFESVLMLLWLLVSGCWSPPTFPKLLMFAFFVNKRD